MRQRNDVPDQQQWYADCGNQDHGEGRHGVERNEPINTRTVGANPCPYRYGEQEIDNPQNMEP